MGSRSALVVTAVVVCVAVGEVAAAAPATDGRQWQVIERVGAGTQPSISSDGRYVAFELMQGFPLLFAHVYVHDRSTGVTRRVSVRSNGTSGNDHSGNASISGDGRYVVFYSEASNLVAGDTNGLWDVFVHDLHTGVTKRVSVHSDGTQGNGEAEYFPAISSDGRFVAFHSEATNLVDNDIEGFWDAFVHDRETGVTERVSLHSDGTPANGNSMFPGVSADGRFVAFHSEASNLVDDDTNGSWDVFVRDRQTGVTQLVSVHTDGTQANGHMPFWHYPVISADGRFVAFHSEASNLVDDDTNGTWDVFVHDRETGVTERISVHSDGTEGNDESQKPGISDDGWLVSFWSRASNLVDGDTSGFNDVFVHDRHTGVTERVSVGGRWHPGQPAQFQPGDER